MKRDQIVYLDDILDSIEMINQYTKNIKVFNFNKRRGKPHVINDLAEAAKGEILIFCDANTLYDKEAIKNLVKNYNDARIGGVSGKLNLIDFEKAKKSGRFLLIERVRATGQYPNGGYSRKFSPLSRGIK